jgi:hypothetical protein
MAVKNAWVLGVCSQRTFFPDALADSSSESDADSPRQRNARPPSRRRKGKMSLALTSNSLCRPIR